jgi:hypothetical protein
VSTEQICGEDDHHVLIGNEEYYISERLLRKPRWLSAAAGQENQPPPDLKYFNQSQK